MYLPPEAHDVPELMKGIYSLKEYYAQDLNTYYEALAVGPSHNYYFGRAEADIALWIEYFCAGVVLSFVNVRNQALKAAALQSKDMHIELRRLTVRQRAVLSLFDEGDTITSKDVEQLLGIASRTARALCQQWTKSGFLCTVNKSKKIRAYALSPQINNLLQDS